MVRSGLCEDSSSSISPSSSRAGSGGGALSSVRIPRDSPRCSFPVVLYLFCHRGCLCRLGAISKININHLRPASAIALQLLVAIVAAILALTGSAALAQDRQRGGQNQQGHTQF